VIGIDNQAKEEEKDPFALRLNVLRRKDENASFPNVKLINDFILESKPQNVVVEMCDERFNESLNEVMKHPKYEMLMERFYEAIEDNDKLVKLSKKSNLSDIRGLEYMVAIDICSFRVTR